MIKGYMYILLCGDGSYYTGSTKNLHLRLKQHQNGEGANHTRKYQPVELVYFETFDRIDKAFYREKQVQGWSRAKKEALINGAANIDTQLNELSKCLNETSHTNRDFGSAQSPALNRGLSEAKDRQSGAENNDTSATLCVPKPNRGLSGAESKSKITNRVLSGAESKSKIINRGLSGAESKSKIINRGLSGAESKSKIINRGLSGAEDRNINNPF